MAEAVYVLCFLTSLVVAVLLARGWRASRQRLLAWSALCFVGLAANNLFLLFDRVLVPDVDFSLWRAASAVLGLGVLLYGLIWDCR